MFKGYVLTRNKRPIEGIKNRTDYNTLEEVQAFKEYGGVLGEDWIMVDVDEMENAKKLETILSDLEIRCNKLYTTRGIHFYFKNTIVSKNAINKPVAIGIPVDIKVGKHPVVVPLKVDGVERKLVTVDDVDQLPRWLQIVKNPPEFLEMSEGDGRNQTIFNYILKLQSHGFQKHEIKDTIEIINKYILKRPLDTSELNTILRDESFNAPTFFNEKGQLLLDDFCQYIKNEERIISIGGQLHVYHEGIYISDKKEIERRIIKYIPNCKKNQRTEVFAMLELIADKREVTKGNFIVLKNGIYNIDTGEISPFDPDVISRNKVMTNYNPSARSEAMDTILNNVTRDNKQLRSLLEEMAGYILLNRNELGKCFILTGEGSNGKSTILKCIKDMVGEENTASLGLDELGQRFKTAELFGKLLNIGDDIKNGYIEDNSVFKKLVTGDAVTVERKGGDPFAFENYSKLLFACNDVPRINDTSNGLKRRLVIIPFNARFDQNRKKYDPFIIDKVKEPIALEYLLLLAIDGLKRVLQTRKFTDVEEVAEVMAEYEKANNPILQFLEDVQVEDETCAKVYERYGWWCAANGYKPVSSRGLGIELKRQGFISKSIKSDGKVKKIYTR